METSIPKEFEKYTTQTFLGKINNRIDYTIFSQVRVARTPKLIGMNGKICHEIVTRKILPIVLEYHTEEEVIEIVARTINKQFEKETGKALSIYLPPKKDGKSCNFWFEPIFETSDEKLSISFIVRFDVR